MKQRRKSYVVLHDIRSEHNVGSIFRTADGAGVEKLYLTGYTPAPVDRFGRLRSPMAKVALGAEQTVPWERVRDILKLIRRLKKENVEVVAVEQAENATDYKKFKPRRDTAFVFGNEVTGLPLRVLKQADRVSQIPMRGTKESLNVSVAAGVALFRMLNV